MITGIHHVQITIPKGCEDEARHFYCQVLGLPEIPKPKSLIARGGFWLQAGDRQVHIGVEDEVERRASKAHVAYEVSNLDTYTDKLMAGGINAVEAPKIPGYKRIEFRDPFGSRLELIQIETIIDRYEPQSAVCRDHDPRTAQVAGIVADLITSHLPTVVVEHIGSTAVPGCWGKGIVDLMLVYPTGHLEPARRALDSLGFQRQTNRDPFPEERPMRTGSVMYDGTRFLLHVHVIAACSPEVNELRSFRDRLRNDPALRANYIGAKKRIIASGCTDPVVYSVNKGEFVMAALKENVCFDKVNLGDKLSRFSEPWQPKIVGELNGQLVKLVKFQGEFVWHHHDQEDELFFVVKGRFRMEFRDHHVWLEEGEFLIVPRGVEHRPVAEEEAHVLLFEPASILNTGNVRNERTVEHLERI
jgi:GrpB-like predicted nucleotidyltransferase (UPF0157 family)/mannose-6-phosphate isomerase-like protein (cupin superfamily)/catechol 2,3-dioxygenase-like lactoylglutathione lyase family enzyme